MLAHTGADRVLWLLEVEFGGGVVRIASAPADITTASGTVLRYAGGLPDVDLAVELSELGGYQTAPQLSFSADWPVDVGALVAAGHPLMLARAWLSLWVEGTTHEARQRLLAGRVTNYAHGAPYEPVSCTIALPQWTSPALVPPKAAMISGATFVDEVTSMHPDLLGKAYPIVFGSPGQVSTAVSATGRRTATRARWCDVRAVADPAAVADSYHIRAVIAAHHVTATRVYAFSPEGTGYRCVVRNGVDDLGQPIAYLPWFHSTTPSTPVAPDDEYDGAYTYHYDDPTDPLDGNPTYALGSGSLPTGFNDPINGFLDDLCICWLDDEDSTRGGISGNAADVLAYLVQRMRLPVDSGRFATAAIRLRAFALDFAIDTRVDPWEFICTHLLPILPVSLVAGPDGIYPVVWRFDATPADVELQLDTADPSVERLGPIETDTSKIANEVSIRYARSARTDTLSGRRTYGGSAYDPADVRTTPHPLCRASQERYRAPDGGPLVVEREINTKVVYRDSTVGAIAEWIIQAYAFGARTVGYRLPAHRARALQLGSVVAVTDADVGLTGALALVTSIRYTSTPMRDIGLRLIGQDGRRG